MKILFISRAYPPVLGGIENQNFDLSVYLPKYSETRTITNRSGKKALPFFLPYALFRALFAMRNYDALLLGDGVLGIVGWSVKLLYGERKKVVSVVHGLDLTYPLPLYQKLWVRKFLPSLDKLIAVGNETIRQGAKRGIPENKFVFIPNGIDTKKFFEPHTKEELEKIIGENLAGRKTILTTGRLAVHKGVDWFCENVVPRLGEDTLYIIAGDGEKRDEIKKIIEKKNIQDKVKMLGRVSDKDLKILYNTADIYVKPNIKVAGTMEGFGLVVIEAASCGLTVVASKLEGLKDAIQEGKNGFLVEPHDADGFVKKINELLADDDLRKDFGAKAREYVLENYTWDKIAKEYIEEISK